MSRSESSQNRFVFPLEIMVCLGSDLEQHTKKGVVFWVHTSVNLLDFAKEVVQDNTEYISQCMDEKKVWKMQGDDLDGQKNYRFVIAQPYIFVEVST